MANSQRGEVSFEASGKTWTMKLGTGALIAIEDQTGKPIGEIGELLGNPKTASLKLMRAVFWGGLQQHHDGTTLAECDDLIDELGGQRVGELIGQAFSLARPKAKEGDTRPPKAPAAA